MNAYEFIIRMKDYASNALTRVADLAGVSDRRVDKLDGGMQRLSRTSGVLSSALKLVGVAIGSIISIGALVGFTHQVIEAREEYEKFQAVLTNTFQSADVGNSAMAMLTDFAAKTPYELNELTGAFVKLVNRGMYPTRKELTELGDLASSQGKTFDQLTEAILDAESSEFERLKEFGIKARVAGDQVTLSFKGVNQTVQNNAESIRNAILEYGRMPGVAGAMASISKTLGGQIANLRDQWWNFLVAVGGESGGIFSKALEMVSRGIQFLQDNLPQISYFFNEMWNAIKPIITAFYDLYSQIFSGMDGMNTFYTILSGVVFVTQLFSEGLSWLVSLIDPSVAGIYLLVGAISLLTIVMYANPIGLIILAIVALIGVIGLAVKYTEGWAEYWKAFKLIFTSVWSQIKSDFNLSVLRFKTGFEAIMLSGENAAQKIMGMFANVGQAIEMALSGDFEGAWAKAFEKVNTKAEAELDKKLRELDQATSENNKLRTQNASNIIDSVGVLNKDIVFDSKGFKEDWEKISGGFSKLTTPGADETQYLDYVKDAMGGSGSGAGKEDKKGKDAKKTDGIVSGGSRQTHINITIGKLQDDTKIYVSSTEKGVSQLGEKVQEMLLRAVNSVNQMQTS